MPVDRKSRYLERQGPPTRQNEGLYRLEVKPHIESAPQSLELRGAADQAFDHFLSPRSEAGLKSLAAALPSTSSPRRKPSCREEVFRRRKPALSELLF